MVELDKSLLTYVLLEKHFAYLFQFSILSINNLIFQMGKGVSLMKRFFSIISSLLVLLLLATTGCSQQTAGPNTLTKTEKEAGWQLLWDGQTTNGWRSQGSEEFPKGCWEIVDGAWTLVEKSQRPGEVNANIVTKEKWSNFELALEFKTNMENTNSGVKIFYSLDSGLGLEYQILIASEKVEGPHNMADLYDLMYCKDPQTNPLGEWNQIKIVSKDKNVEHWLNGNKVLEYVRGDEKFMEAKAKSKFKDDKEFGLLESGHIMLQDHPGSVSFRNIKIREL